MKRIFILSLLLTLSLAAFPQKAEEVVRSYISTLNEFLLSPNTFSKRSAFENSLQNCLIQDGIYIKYKGNVSIDDCKGSDYAGIISEAINANPSHTYAKVEIARSLQTTGSGSRYEVTAYLHYSGAIEMRTVTVFHINNDKISAMTNDYIKTKEWNADDSHPDPPKPVQQQPDNKPSQQPSSDTHPYVDLGLPSGTLWATTNIGAANPWDYGDYFAWGETTTKSKYDWSTYKYANGASNKLTKYCTESDYGNNGFTDSRTILESSDDAATANWGSDWCMPTLDQIKELRGKCEWVWTTDHGVNGYKGTGPNGNSLFLPAAGYRYGTDLLYVGSRGNYWSRSSSGSTPGRARSLWIDSYDVIGQSNNRAYGRTVRPVRCKN